MLRVNKTGVPRGSLKKIWLDKDYSCEPEPYNHFRILQRFGVHLVGIFSRRDMAIMAIHLSIKVKVCFFCPQNVTQLRNTNRHSREKLKHEYFAFTQVVPFQFLNSFTLILVKVQNSTLDMSDRGVGPIKVREIFDTLTVL